MLTLLQYTFFQNALTACLLAGIVCGLVGTYIVCRRMVFVSGGIAHASLGGVGLCALMGCSPMIGATTFALLTGWGTQSLSNHKETRQDSIIAMLWTLGMSIGIICSFLSPEFLPSLSSYLFGNILLINTTDLLAMAILAVIVCLFFTLCLPQIVAIAFDPSFAKSQRQPVQLTEYLMVSLIALSIVSTLKVAGIVLVISLLSVPQLTAGLFCHNFVKMAIWSVIIALVGCFGGLFLSTWLNVPCGAMVVAVLIVVYLLSSTIKHSIRSYKVRYIVHIIK